MAAQHFAPNASLDWEGTDESRRDSDIVRRMRRFEDFDYVVPDPIPSFGARLPENKDADEAARNYVDALYREIESEIEAKARAAEEARRKAEEEARAAEEARRKAEEARLARIAAQRSWASILPQIDLDEPVSLEAEEPTAPEPHDSSASAVIEKMFAEVALAVEGTSVKTQDGNREEDAVVDVADVTPSLEFDEVRESLGLESGTEQVPETPEMSIESDEGADEDGSVNVSEGVDEDAGIDVSESAGEVADEGIDEDEEIVLEFREVEEASAEGDSTETVESMEELDTAEEPDNAEESCTAEATEIAAAVEMDAGPNLMPEEPTEDQASEVALDEDVPELAVPVDSTEQEDESYVAEGGDEATEGDGSEPGETVASFVGEEEEGEAEVAPAPFEVVTDATDMGDELAVALASEVVVPFDYADVPERQETETSLSDEERALASLDDLSAFDDTFNLDEEIAVGAGEGSAATRSMAELVPEVADVTLTDAAQGASGAGELDASEVTAEVTTEAVTANAPTASTAESAGVEYETQGEDDLFDDLDEPASESSTLEEVASKAADAAESKRVKEMTIPSVDEAEEAEAVERNAEALQGADEAPEARGEKTSPADVIEDVAPAVEADAAGTAEQAAPEEEGDAEDVSMSAAELAAAELATAVEDELFDDLDEPASDVTPVGGEDTASHTVVATGGKRVRDVRVPSFDESETGDGEEATDGVLDGAADESGWETPGFEALLDDTYDLEEFDASFPMADEVNEASASGDIAQDEAVEDEGAVELTDADEETVSAVDAVNGERVETEEPLAENGDADDTLQEGEGGDGLASTNAPVIVEVAEVEVEGEVEPVEDEARPVSEIVDVEPVEVSDDELDDLDEVTIETVTFEVTDDDIPSESGVDELDDTLVLDRVAEAVRKLRVEGESAPVEQVEVTTAPATEIHTEYVVDVADLEASGALPEIGAEGGAIVPARRRRFNIFARIGSAVAKVLRLDDRK